MRHGEPVGGRKYRGQKDDPLSEKGWEEMRAAVGGQRPWSAIISSPLSRCAAFARELAARHHLPLEFDRRLVERCFGAWEGRKESELEENDPHVLMRFFTDPIKHGPPGAEALGDFYARVVAAWNDLLGRHHGRHVLVIGHAGIIRMTLSHVLGVPLKHAFRVRVPSAGITRICVERKGGYTVARMLFHGGSLVR